MGITRGGDPAPPFETNKDYEFMELDFSLLTETRCCERSGLINMQRDRGVDHAYH